MTANIDQVLEKFALTGKDLETLKKGAKLVLPILDDVLDYFYDFAGSDAEIAEFFPNSSVMAHARKEQKHHWELLLSGEFNQEFLESADRIGRVHFRIQLPFLMYLSGYSQAMSKIQTMLLKHSGGMFSKVSQSQIAEFLPVLTRAFSLDTHFVIEAYFSAQQEEQNIAFRHLKTGMERMANKDLSADIPSSADSDYPERYDDIRLSFNDLISSIRSVILTIQQTTDGLDQRAEEVNSAAQDLSRRTETQAATLEETAAAVEEINASVSSSAEATSKTNSVVTEARQNAKRGNTIVRETISKMKEIAESSAQMSKIIGVIDDISFQTNLLALNAGVEAARAGEAGRGFAVVASEVRSLAQRAADSAQEINALIKSSTQIVESGVSLVDQAGEALDSIVKDVETASNLTNEITSSSQEQSIGLSEISTGVSQLDSVTQQNAAMVEETAAAVASMQNDTNMMAGLVRQFQLNQGNAAISAHPASTFDSWDNEASSVPMAM